MENRLFPLSGLTLVSSNQNKLREIRKFGLSDLQIETGVDLDEVDGTADEVIVHKAIAAGNGRIVEDSILVIDGEEIVDARYRLHEVLKWVGSSVFWEVRLGVNYEGWIFVFKGSVDGTIAEARGVGFDFDPYFLIEPERKSLAELAAVGRKNEYSPRKFAFDRLVAGEVDRIYRIDDVPAWRGGFQA